MNGSKMGSTVRRWPAREGRAGQGRGAAQAAAAPSRSTATRAFMNAWTTTARAPLLSGPRPSGLDRGARGAVHCHIRTSLNTDAKRVLVLSAALAALGGGTRVGAQPATDDMAQAPPPPAQV